MKKILNTLLIIVCAAGFTFAQKNNTSPELQAERKMRSIERKMKTENTDVEGVKLIKEHEKTMKVLKSKMNALAGYGKAATSKQSLQKFREKNANKNADFKVFSDNEINARKAMVDYIAGTNEEYKKAIPLAKLVK